MSSYAWPPLSSSGGIPIYSTLAAFPAGTIVGQLGVAADTGNLYEWNGSSWQLIGGPASALSLGALDAQAGTAQGAALVSGVLSMQSASGTVPGLVNTATQTFAGQKTFSTGLTGTLTGAASLNVLTSALGNFTDSTSGADGIGVTGGTAATVGNVVIAQLAASASQNGYLKSADWSTFNAKQAAGTYLTSLSVASTNGFAGSSSGGATPSLTISTSITGILQGNGTAISAATTTGSGNVVLATAPTLSNPVVGTQSQLDGSTKAASTSYVDTAVANAVAGLNPAVAVQAATVSSSDTTGYTYINGVSGVGATLTAGSNNVALTVDGYTFTALGQRLLVKNNSTPANNGIYYVTQVQASLLPVILTRALDYDQPSDINNTGAIPVINGTANGTTSWVETALVNTVGTDPLTFVQFTQNPANYLLKANNLSDVASASTAINNILPSQTGNSGKFLGTNGSAASWSNPSSSVNSPNLLQNLGLATSVASNALTIALKQEDGATDPAASPNNVVIAERSSTATSGSYNLRSVTAALSIVVPSGATLGQTSAVNQYVWIYALDNAGTIELAVSGVTLFPDNSIQTSTTIGAGSTSGSTLYSATGRTSVPIRLIGRLLVNETTAGTWASAPTDVIVTTGSQSPTLSDMVAYTPTYSGLGTVTGSNVFWSRRGDKIFIQGFFTTGTVTASQVQITLPSGLTTSANLTTGWNLGTITQSNVSNSGYYMLSAASLTYLQTGLQNSGAPGQGAANGSTIFGNNTNVSFTAEVPIKGWSTYGP